MKKIGFIGAFDKIDLVIYTGKILAELRKRVLIIDATILQKTRYIVPCLEPTKFYVTEFEGMDIAVGFENLEELNEYLGSIESEYDVVLVDIDSYDKFNKFELENSEKFYFVTAFDGFSLKKGIEMLQNIDQIESVTKVLFERDFSEENDRYLNFLALKCAAKWDKEKIYFPFEQGDLTEIMENQKVSKIRFKNLTEIYREGLFNIVQGIAPEAKKSEVKRILKNL